MRLFLLAFLLVYALMHLLVWWGCRPLFGGSRLFQATLLGWFLLMLFAPALTRLLEQSGSGTAAVAMAWTGYLWMGFLWLAFSLFFALGLWNGAVWLAGTVNPVLRGWTLAGPRPAAVALGVVAVAGLWAFFEARHLGVETVRLEVAGLPAERDRVRIVQISDLHLGLLNHRPLLQEVIDRTRALAPDLVVVTGDLLDAQPDHLDGLAPLWRELTPPLGKFAVAGNHEVYAGKAHALAFLREGGFEVLHNRRTEVAGIQLAGVPDPAWGDSRPDAEILAGADPRRLLILLKHRPLVDPAAVGRFTLQLSGHTHRGQIFPFNLLTGLAYPRQDGLYRLADGCWLYTSRGTGSWGPPMRLFSPPELTVIELAKRKE